MLQWINDRMKVIGWIFILPLAHVFAVWGVHGIVDFTSAQERALSVNGEQVDVQRLRQVYQEQVAELHRSFPDEIPAELTTELKQSIADQFVNATLLDQMAAERRYVVSDQQVVDSIRNLQAFQVNGQFNHDSYVALLRQQGIEPAEFEAQQRQALRARQFEAGLALSSFATPRELARAVALRNEQREIAWAVVPAARFLGTTNPTEAQLQAWYEKNQDQYRTPESVTLSYVRLRLDDVKAQVTVDEAGLRAFYDSVSERYQAAEQRRARHILVQSGTDDAAAQKRAQDLYAQATRPGADFAALARANSQDAGSAQQGGDLGWAEKSFFVGPFADAVWAMQPGEIRGPVKTQFGWHVIKLEEIQAGHQKSFEEARAELEDEYRRTEAERVFGERQESLDTLAFENTGSLEPVAKALGLAIVTVPNFTRTAGGGEFTQTPAVTQAAFSADVLAGQNSPAIELAPGDVLVLRAADHKLPQPQPLDAVRAQVVGAVRAELAAEQARATATRLAEQLKGGTAWDAALKPLAPVAPSASPASPAAATAVRFQPAKFFARSDMGVPSEVLNRAFRVAQPDPAKPAIDVARLMNGDYAAFAVANVRKGEAPAETEPLEKQALAAAAARADVFGYVAAMRDEAEINFNPAVFD